MKRSTLNTRWLAKPVAMATLLVSLLGGVPGALAAPLGLDLIPIGADPAFWWMLLLPNDPPAMIDPA